MKIGITGGKGGTGKSLVSTALASELAGRRKKVLLIDADVDCPNDHLILSIERKKLADVEGAFPIFDSKKCIKCGKCSEACMENAIVSVKDRVPILVPEQCTGCKACALACPVGAISYGKQGIGTIYSGEKNSISLLTGEIKIGFEEASPIVHALMGKAAEIEERFDYVLVDTAAGTHCNVISALVGVEHAFAVTEPTPLGEHDLQLILKLLDVLGIKKNIVLNKAGIAGEKRIERIAEEFNAGVVSKIPYKREIMQSYSRGEAIKGKEIEKIADAVEGLQ